MNLRREERLEVPIGVLVAGLDSSGKIRVQPGKTLDISSNGCCLTDLQYCYASGTIIGIQNGDRKARFRVVWSGEPGTPREGQIGVERLGNQRDVNTKLLYVDGERQSVESRRSILQALHYEVALGESGREAFERLEQDRYNAVIMGHPLSDLETSDLLVGVRRANVSSKILLLSAYPRVHESLLELADGFVYKRQPHNEFISTIEKVLEGPKARKFPLVRALPRYSIRVPLAVQVLRAGIRETFYGTSNDLSERGIAATVKTHFTPGELVRLFFSLPNRPEELEAQAIVRHRKESVFGFEFVAIDERTVDAIQAFCAVLPPLSNGGR